MDITKDYLTYEETAKYLNVSKSTVRRLVLKMHLKPPVTVCESIRRFRLKDVQEFAERLK